MSNLKENIENIVSLYTIDSSIIEGISGETNVLFFTNEGNIGKLYRGAGEGKPLQYIGSETASRLERMIKIYGNDFDGSKDVSTNLYMNGLLDNSTGEGIFNNIKTNKINSENGIYLGNGVIYFKDGDKECELKLKEDLLAELKIEATIKTKTFKSVEDVFNNEINDISDDEIGTTYFVEKGNNDNATPETFILNSNREIIPTSSYIFSKDTPNSIYNYEKGNIIWIDKSYSNNNYNDLDDNSGAINDNTIITPNNYYELKRAIDKLYYILGIDLDAGKVEDSNDKEGEGIDCGEFNNETETTSSNYGVILTDLNYNQKTAFNDFNTEEKPEWLAVLDEENGGENVDYDAIVLPDELNEELTNLGEHFVKAIRIKRGKYSDMMDVSNYLLDGELIWCKYDVKYPTQSNKLFIKSTDKFNVPQFYCINVGASNEDNKEDDYLTELVDIEKIDWLTDNLTKYRLDVNNQGKITVSPICKNQDSLNSYYNSSKNRYKIYINSLYCGGLNSNKIMFRPCSHNFVELSNLTNYDINLEEAKVSLQYIDRTRYNSTTDKLSWEILPLTGTIKAGGT